MEREHLYLGRVENPVKLFLAEQSPQQNRSKVTGKLWSLTISLPYSKKFCLNKHEAPLSGFSRSPENEKSPMRASSSWDKTPMGTGEREDEKERF